MPYYKRSKYIFIRFIAFMALLFLIQKCSNAQNPPQKVNSYYQFKGVIGDSSNTIPFVQPSLFYRNLGSLWLNTIDSSFNYWTGTRWIHLTVNNGLSDSAHTFQLGEPVGQSGSPARLYSRRSIPTNGFMLSWLDSVENSSTKSSVRLWDTTVTPNTGSRIPLKMIQNNPVGLFDWKQPYNYGVTYHTPLRPGTGNQRPGAFNSGYASAVSGDSMPDNVYQLFGYNTNANGNRTDTSEASARVSFETNFAGVIDGFGLDFEYHDPEVTLFNGTIFRTDSKYINKKTGYCFDQSFVDDHEYWSVKTNAIYAQIVASNSGQAPNFNLYGTTGFASNGAINFNSSNGTSTHLVSNDNNLFIGNNTNTIDFTLNGNGDLSLNQSNSLNPSTWHSTLIGMDSTGHTLPAASAQLEIQSVHKGYLGPRMTTIQKLAISSPAEGLEVYDLTLHQKSYFNGTTWINF